MYLENKIHKKVRPPIEEEKCILVAGMVKLDFLCGRERKRHLEFYLIPNTKVDFRPGGKL